MRSIVSLVVASVLTACSGSAPTEDTRPAATVRFARVDAALRVDVADTPALRRRGLMGVDQLPVDEGMAFVWDEPVRSVFWMKDTLIPLSVAFVDEAGRVVGVRDMQPCVADPCPTYGADAPYVLAVEANLGWFDEHGIQVGDRADLEMPSDG